VTEHERDAGPGAQPGPAREQIVIKNNRKIDPSGRPKDPAGREPADRESADKSRDAMADAPRDDIGQPGTTVAQPKDGGKAASEETKDEVAKGADKAAPAKDKPAPAKDAVPAALSAELEALRSELDERLRDLQRVSAEYANYRKRVERDRNLVVEQAVGAVLTAVLPILDDVDRAREHGDLTGPFAAVAEQLTTALGKLGLTAFGEKGDPFDPTRHEAVTHETSADVTEPTCVSVMRRGYLLGERLLRPAMVAVADPE